MHVPQSSINPATTILPLTGIDSGVHKFVGVSWHVLMPYTVIGVGLIVYCQIRLMLGQRQLSRMSAKRRKPNLQKRIRNKLTTPKLVLEIIK